MPDHPTKRPPRCRPSTSSSTCTRRRSRACRRPMRSSGRTKRWSRSTAPDLVHAIAYAPASCNLAGELESAIYRIIPGCFLRRSSAVDFLTVGMGAGAAVLIVVGVFTGSIAALKSFGMPQWIADIYLGVGGGAAAFILCVLALQRASPTRVANTMTLNPIAAALLATELVGAPITPNLVLGLSAVFAGIWIATSGIKKP